MGRRDPAAGETVCLRLTHRAQCPPPPPRNAHAFGALSSYRTVEFCKNTSGFNVILDVCWSFRELVRFSAEAENLFTKLSRRWVQGAFSPGVKRAGTEYNHS